jgi:hypothetical protein
MVGPLVLALVGVAPWLAAICWIAYRQGFRAIVPRDAVPASMAARVLKRR